ncbi:MAG: DUF4153 domain-containing protein [Patescibacteria group bacterium]
MRLVAITIVLTSILAGIIHASVSSVAEVRFLLIPHLLMTIAIGFWLFKVKQIRVTIFSVAWLLAYIGALVWDHNQEFFFLKFLILPGLLSFVIHKEELNRMKFFASIRFLFPILIRPVSSVKTYIREFVQSSGNIKQGKEKPAHSGKTTATHADEEEISFPIAKTITIGIIFGLILLVILLRFDSDFATFIKFPNIQDILRYGIIWFVAQVITFFWFAWHPATITPHESHIHSYRLRSFLQGIIILSTAVFIGYTSYDVYIIFRIAGAIELMFESIGQNTQLYYIELMGLGGFLLFLSSFFANGLLSKKATPMVKRRVYIVLLLAATILLLPPLINLFRILLTIYIPEYGLSARRLFGIYSGIAFIGATVTFWWYLVKSNRPSYAQVLVVFLSTIAVLTYALPTNYMIFQSQMDPHGFTPVVPHVL